MMNNKFFSNKQEQTVADYLGWKQVVGSGSRPTFTGDIESDKWLGECKTHTKPNQRIVFHTDVFAKIVSEASAKFKQPAYFVDDGSQDTSRTWVMILDRSVSSNFSISPYPYPVNNTITYIHKDLIKMTQDNTLYKLRFGAYDVLVMQLYTFYNLI